MNLTIAKAMVREQIQRTLPILAVSLGISAALCLAHYVSLWWHSPNGEFIVTTMLASHVIGILGLLYCHSDNRDMQVAMPAFLLRLPVRTIDLVMVRMGYGLLFVALIGVWNSLIHYPLLSQQSDPSFGFWTPCLIGITAYALLQAFAWSIGGLGILILVCAGPTILMFSASFGYEIDPKTIETIDPSHDTAQATLTALAVSLLIAYVGVRTRRSSRFDVDPILSALPSMFSGDHSARRPPFTSPQQAMRWFEWRRQSRLLPLLVGIGSVVFTFLYLKGMAREGMLQSSSHATMLAAYGMTVALACYLWFGFGAVGFGAYSFFQNQRLQVGPLKTFLFIRPVSTKQIAQARIVVVLRSVVISMVPFLLAYAVATLLSIRDTEPTEYTESFKEHMELGGVGIALWLFGFFGIIWCFQWSGNLLALVAVLGPAGLIGLILLAFIDVEASREEVLVTSFASWMTACVAIAASTYAFYKALECDLVETKTLYVALAAWPLLVAGFAVSLNPQRFIRGGGFSELAFHEVGACLVFAVLPIVPLATVPLVMQYARHQ